MDTFVYVFSSRLPMTIYIALLRGINVGGHKKIKMAELKSIFESLDLARVQTHIQSGNVLFASGEDREPLRVLIEGELIKVCGFSVTVMLRTAAELERIIADCPYTDGALEPGESVHVAVLNEVLSQQAVDILAGIERGHDEYHVHGREIYFLFRQSILDSKVAKSLQKLGVTMTMRNWTTIHKLAILARS